MVKRHSLTPYTVLEEGREEMEGNMTAETEHDRIDLEIARNEKSSDPFASAVRATRMPMLITDPNQPDNPIVFVNDAFARLTGYSREETLGRNCRFLQGPDTDPDDVAALRDAVARRSQIELEIVNHRKDGTRFHNRVLISPVFDENGHLTYFFASQFDVTLERERLVRLQRDHERLEREVDSRTRELRLSEERLRFSLQAAGAGAWTLDLHDMRLTSSEICKRNFGRAAADPFTYADLIDAIIVEDRAAMQDAVRQAIATSAEYQHQYRIKTPSGETRWIFAKGRPHYDAHDQPISMSGVTLDVTETRRNEEQRILLTAELKHRVKNTMATFQAIAMQTLRNATDIDEATAILGARIQTLATAHDLLTREDWQSATIAEIVSNGVRTFEVPGHPRFRVAGPDVSLPPRAATSLILALHELATNAVKYGALSVPEGHIVIDWHVTHDAGEARLELRWQEFGGPPIRQQPLRRGFGSRLIERVLATELNGKATAEFLEAGLRYTLNAPLPNQDKTGGGPSDEKLFHKHIGLDV